MVRVFYNLSTRSVKYAIYFDILLDGFIMDAENNKVSINNSLKNVIIADSMFIDSAYLLKNKKMLRGIKGVFWADAVLKNYPIYRKYLRGRISNVGSGGIIKYNEILNINPDLVILIDWDIFNPLGRWLKDKNLLYVKTGNYKEPKFLGKIEWIKFYASLYNKYKKSEKIFNKIAEESKEIFRLISTYKINYKPVIAFFGYHKHRAYVYGRSHYIPNLIKDLKGNYLFDDFEGCSYRTIDRKEFINRTKYADVCILDTMGEEIDPKDILKENPEFLKFKAYKNGRFYITPKNYLKYETLKSPKLLEDYLKIIHPKIYQHSSGNDLNYFIKVI